MSQWSDSRFNPRERVASPPGSSNAGPARTSDAFADFVKRELPFGRFGRADEIGDVVAFLVSPRASWISGTTVVVDGCQSRSF